MHQHLMSIPDVGIAGVAGMVCHSTAGFDRGRNRILHGAEKAEWERGREISDPTEVQTVDEFCFIIPSEVFSQEELSERICDGWHLYAVEYCLRIKQDTDYKVYVLPIDVWHGSQGMPVDRSYYQNLTEISNVYGSTDMIHTTVGSWINNTRYLSFIYYSFVVSESILPNKLDSVVKAWWPLIFGGALAELYVNGIKSIPEIIGRFIKKISAN
jgi:hypothetical protein